jgi:hypothetical protein
MDIHGVGEAAHDRQAQAAAAIGLGPNAVEGLEHIALVFARDSGAIVDDVKDDRCGALTP